MKADSVRDISKIIFGRESLEVGRTNDKVNWRKSSGKEYESKKMRCTEVDPAETELAHRGVLYHTPRPRVAV